MLLEQNYVHLPLKMAMHAVNPVQRLRLLRTQLTRQTAQTMGPEWLFHREMASIFMSVRDLHTNYLLPKPFAGKVAYLPFVLEKATEPDGDHYLVTSIVTGFTAPGFGLGVEVTHWNGVPIGTAVEINGLRLAGSNRAASLARGLDSLTIRPLLMQLPPEEDWIDVTYVDRRREHGRDAAWPGRWRPTCRPRPISTRCPPRRSRTPWTWTPTSATERAKQLYHPDVVRLENEQTEAGQLAEPQAVGAADVADHHAVGLPRPHGHHRHGTFGQIRIFTFCVQDPVGFRDEFVRLISLLPQNGLIVDVRGNGGGHMHASEFTLQTLTPRRDRPGAGAVHRHPAEPGAVPAAPGRPEGIDLGPWFSSLDQSVETGATFSSAFTITPSDGRQRDRPDATTVRSCW